MAQQPNFMMLTSKLHALFKNYIIRDRVRCPPEYDLTDLISSFQPGALTDRRALQSKFRNWAKRMAVENGELVLASSGKVIIPGEMCEELVMSLHLEEHLEVEYLIFKIQQKYTWTKRNFGMDRDIVIRVILRHCHKEKCIREIKSFLSNNKSYLRNPLTTLQPKCLQDYKMTESSRPNCKSYGCYLGIHSKNEVLKKNYFTFCSDIHSKNPKDSKCYQTSPKPTLFINEETNVLENSRKGRTDSTSSELLYLNVLSVEPKVKYEQNKAKQIPTFYKENYMSQIKVANSEESNPLFPKCPTKSCRKCPYESESFSCGNDKPVKRLCEEVRNVNDFRKMVNLAEDNLKGFPEVFSNPKTKFLSTLGLAPKRIFSKKTLSDFNFEFRKKLLMDKHQALAKRKVLRDRNKMFKTSHYSTCPPSSAIQNMKWKRLKNNDESKQHRVDSRNDEGKYTAYPKDLSKHAYQPFLNAYGNDLLNKSHHLRGSNRMFNSMSESVRRPSFKEHCQRVDKLNEMNLANACKRERNVVSKSELQQNSRFHNGLSLSEYPKDINCVDSSASAKSPEIIDITLSSDEEPDSNRNDSKNAFKSSSSFQDVNSINPLHSSPIKNEFLVNGQNPQIPFQPNRNEFQKKVVFNHTHPQHETPYARPFFVPTTPGNMHLFPPMRFPYPFTPIVPHPFLMNNGFLQMQQPGGLNFNAPHAQLLRPRALYPMMADVDKYNKESNNNKLMPNLPSSNQATRLPYSVPNFNINTPTFTTSTAYKKISCLDASRSAPRDYGKLSAGNSSAGNSDTGITSQSKSDQKPSFSYANRSFTKPNILMRSPLRKKIMPAVCSDDLFSTSRTKGGKDMSNVNKNTLETRRFNLTDSSGWNSTNSYSGVGINAFSGKVKPPLGLCSGSNPILRAHGMDATYKTMDSKVATFHTDIRKQASHENTIKTLFIPERKNPPFLKPKSLEIQHNISSAANSLASSHTSHFDVDMKSAKENNFTISNPTIAGPTYLLSDPFEHNTNSVSNSIGSSYFTPHKRHVEWIGKPTYVLPKTNSIVPNTNACKMAPKVNIPSTDACKRDPKGSLPNTDVCKLASKGNVKSTNVCKIVPKEIVPSTKVCMMAPKGNVKSTEVCKIAPKENVPSTEVCMFAPKGNVKSTNVCKMAPKENVPSNEVCKMASKGNVPSTDVSKMTPKQNDNSAKVPNTFKVLIMNPPTIKKSLPIPDVRRIFPKSDTSNIVGKNPISQKDENCRMNSNENIPLDEESDLYLEKQNRSMDSLVNNFNESQAKDSGNRSMDGEMKTLSHWINKMSSNLNLSIFRPGLLDSIKSLTDDLGVGINLVQSIRNSLNDTEME